MNEVDVLDLASLSVWTLMVCGGPAVMSAMAVGITIALMQALTQIQEATLTFVPKMVVVCLVVGFTATASGRHFFAFCEQVYGKIESGFSH